LQAQANNRFACPRADSCPSLSNRSPIASSDAEDLAQGPNVCIPRAMLFAALRSACCW